MGKVSMSDCSKSIEVRGIEMEKNCSLCHAKFEYKDEGISGYFGLLKVDFCDFCLACMGAMHESLKVLLGEEE